MVWGGVCPVPDIFPFLDFRPNITVEQTEYTGMFSKAQAEIY
jgi:hypothetical protein